MKKTLISIIVVFSIIIGNVFCDMPSFEGGLVGDPTMEKDEYFYQEMLFISGEPILMQGVIKIPNVKEKNTYNITYEYTLQNKEKNAVLERKATYKVSKEIKKDYRQTIYDYELEKLEEKIEVNGVKYELSSFLFNQSKIEDNTAAVDYYSGNIYLKRTYFIGDQFDNEGKITIETTANADEGAFIGYNHLWGNANTYIANVKISGEKKGTDGIIEWDGFVDLRTSKQVFSEFKYQKTSPQSISFVGSYVRSDKIENVFQYSYDLPELQNFKPTGIRNVGENTIRNDSIVDGSSMVIPKYKDIGGHWAEDKIFLLGSLEIADNDSEYFGPNLPLTRIDYARLISNAISTVSDRTVEEFIKDLRPGHEDMFYDIQKDHKYYNYVKYVYNTGLMHGYSDYFWPDDTITRAEAITVLIRALGLENRAPALPFETRYDDDVSIPSYAKRAIYMADEIGLIKGYPDNTIRPKAFITRAEGVYMIYNFIMHMKDNIRIDFRERIINRY